MFINCKNPKSEVNGQPIYRWFFKRLIKLLLDVCIKHNWLIPGACRLSIQKSSCTFRSFDKPKHKRKRMIEWSFQSWLCQIGRAETCSSQPVSKRRKIQLSMITSKIFYAWMSTYLFTLNEHPGKVKIIGFLAPFPGKQPLALSFVSLLKKKSAITPFLPLCSNNSVG